jgi:hypothetical protein
MTLRSILGDHTAIAIDSRAAAARPTNSLVVFAADRTIVRSRSDQAI